MKSVFGFHVRLGNPDLDFENLNPDSPIERTLRNNSKSAYIFKGKHNCERNLGRLFDNNKKTRSPPSRQLRFYFNKKGSTGTLNTSLFDLVFTNDYCNGCQGFRKRDFEINAAIE